MPLSAAAMAPSSETHSVLQFAVIEDFFGLLWRIGRSEKRRGAIDPRGAGRQRRADGVAAVTRVWRNEDAREESGQLHPRVHGRAVEQAAPQAEPRHAGAGAHLAQELHQQVGDPGLQGSGQRRGHRSPALGLGQTVDLLLEVGGDGKSVGRPGNQGVDPVVSRGRLQLGERGEAPGGIGRIEPQGSATSRQHARKPRPLPRPGHALQHRAVAHPHAHLGRIAIADHHGRRGKRRRQIGGGGVSEVVVDLFDRRRGSIAVAVGRQPPIDRRA